MHLTNYRLDHLRAKNYWKFDKVMMKTVSTVFIETRCSITARTLYSRIWVTYEMSNRQVLRCHWKTARKSAEGHVWADCSRHMQQ